MMRICEKLRLPRNLSYRGALQEMNRMCGHAARFFLIMSYGSVRVLCR